VRLEKVHDPFPQFVVPTGYSLPTTSSTSRARLRQAAKHPARAAGYGRLKHSLDEYEQRLAREIASSGRCSSPDISSSFGISSATLRSATSRSGRDADRQRIVGGLRAVDHRYRSALERAAVRALPQSRTRQPADIDIDFCMNRRGEVIDYVTQKYGAIRWRRSSPSERWRQKPRSKIPAAPWIFPMPKSSASEDDSATLNITIDRALKDSPDLAAAYDKEPQTKELIDTAKKLEGLVRNSGVHAAGVVISPIPLPIWCRCIAPRTTKLSPLTT